MTSSQSIIDRIGHSASMHTDRTAITDAGRVWTYGELWHESEVVALGLQSRGITPGDRLGIIIDSSAEYVIAYLAALRLGAIAVPMNAAAKTHDFSVWLEHCGASLTITSCAHAEQENLTRCFGERVTTIEALRNPTVDQASQHLAIPVLRPETAACILYTSGTTGAPKGILLAQGNLLSNSLAIIEYLHLTCEDSILCIVPFHYSYGTSILHTHLMTGAHIVIERNFVYPHKVLAAIAEHAVTGFAGVPSTFALLLSRTQMADFNLASLRYVTQAGGFMPWSLTQRLRQTLPKVSLYLMYGQTEATARITYLPPKDLERKPGSVGIAINGVRLEIRNDDGTPCPIGTEGTLWISGANVMTGYWNNPEATATVLREDWLNTGDAGRLDNEGYLYLAGRRSDMIKSGAHRIHPAEIEEAIQALDGVAEVAAIGVEDELLGQTIKAFIVPVDGKSIDSMKIKAHCRDRLAAYKIPKHIEIITALPKTANGKIRRNELIKKEFT